MEKGLKRSYQRFKYSIEDLQAAVEAVQNGVLTRASVTEANISNWFDDLRKYLEEEKALDVLDDPDQIYNADETGVRLCPKTEKRFRLMILLEEKGCTEAVETDFDSVQDAIKKEKLQKKTRRQSPLLFHVLVDKYERKSTSSQLQLRKRLLQLKYEGQIRDINTYKADCAIQETKDEDAVFLMGNDEPSEGVTSLRCDNSPKYINEEFKKYSEEKGIRIENAISYSSQLNGKAERMTQTLLEMAQCLIVDKQWFGYKPDYQKIRLFWFTTYLYIPSERRKKLDEKTITCRNVIFDENMKTDRDEILDSKDLEMKIKMKILNKKQYGNNEPQEREQRKPNLNG
ncbi:hypothetical protein ILUMI_02276 [Ignelater luminosus]|uniref:Integrase catalytic domain-containing protein n=1 Tax=Ignelater luminosus TaxID=2038154 RepID=A0A8K0DGQ8_IGNLU|nr:hypothetical protein ILUMI_02276 [Ignelater luminosus]